MARRHQLSSILARTNPKRQVCVAGILLKDLVVVHLVVLATLIVVQPKLHAGHDLLVGHAADYPPSPTKRQQVVDQCAPSLFSSYSHVCPPSSAACAASYYCPIRVRVSAGQSKGPVLEQGLKYAPSDLLDRGQRMGLALRDQYDRCPYRHCCDLPTFVFSELGCAPVASDDVHLHLPIA